MASAIACNPAPTSQTPATEQILRSGIGGVVKLCWASARPPNVQNSVSAQIPRSRHALCGLNRVHDFPVRPGSKRLTESEGPRELLQGIVHAIIGHYALLREGGCLHGDVSVANIRLLTKKDIRKPCTDFEATKEITECLAVIIDGDYANKGAPCTPESPWHHAGTKEFMSIRLTKDRLHKRASSRVPFDDLESYFWVLIYCLLVKAKETGVITPTEKAWFRNFSSDQLNLLAATKASITFATDDKRFSRPVSIFWPLLQVWIRIAKKVNKQKVGLVGPTPPLDPGLKVKECYESYINAAIAHLPNLPETWEEVLDGQSIPS